MQKPIYFDYCATTPLDPRILPEMLPWFCEKFGNPANLTHTYGREALLAVHTARMQIAALLKAHPHEIYFTSGATESNNLVFKGLAHLWPEKSHVLTVATEHKSVLYAARSLCSQGFEVEILPVDASGRVDPDLIARRLRPETALVSVMYVNNEVGTLQPVAEIGALCRSRNVLYHCDAVQAGGKLALDVEALGIDLLSLSAHKLYGPKGIGCLYVRRKQPPIPLQPCLQGGGQESGLRAGTLNVPAIVGFGKAAELAQQELETEAQRLKDLRQQLWQGIAQDLDGVHLSCPLELSVPSILHLCVLGLKPGRLIHALKSLALSTGSACSSGSGKISYVLEAMGMNAEQAGNALRFSLGRFTTVEDIQFAVSYLIETVTQLRAQPSTWPIWV